MPRPAQIACLSAPALLVGIVLSACGSNTGGAASAADKASGAGSTTAMPTTQTASRACHAVPAPEAKGQQRLTPPRLKLDPVKRYRVTLATNCGAIAIALEVDQAPRTTASFAYLVERGFYDSLTFHRVATGFVIQGGDPDGDGSGGPGYTVVEPPPKDARYTLGTVAMAKTGTDPAGASGSQFFIVTAPEAALPPEYALVGHVVGGLEAVKAIGKLPTDPPQDGTPRIPVVIAKATLSVS